MVVSLAAQAVVTTYRTILATGSSPEPFSTGSFGRPKPSRLLARRCRRAQIQPMVDLAGSLQAALCDRYPLDGELGRGGMAVVFRAQDRRHHRSVAIQALRPEVAAAFGPDRFLQEIELASQLVHPNIVPIFDSGAVEAPNGQQLLYDENLMLMAGRALVMDFGIAWSTGDQQTRLTGTGFAVGTPADMAWMPMGTGNGMKGMEHRKPPQ